MPTTFETDLSGDAPASATTAFLIDIGGTAQGEIGAAGDTDFIAVDLVAGESYCFAMVGIGLECLTNPLLRLIAPDGSTELALNDDGLPNLNATFSFTAIVSGRYYLAASATGTGTGSYGVAASAGDKADVDLAMIAGVLDSHASWTATRGSGVNLSFGFSDSIDHGQTGFQHFTEAQKETTRAVLAHFAEITGLSFTEVNPGGYTDAAVLLYGNYSAEDGSGAWGGLPADPDFASTSGDVWVNTAAPPTEAPQPGSWYYQMMLHEIGHSMGLTHPGLYDAGGGSAISFGVDAQFWQDSAQFTVMSYFAADDPQGAGLPEGVGGSALQADTLGLCDMLALQQIYGANSATRAGNTVYGFGATAGGVYDFVQNLDPMLTIWDGGGHDRLDLSRYAADQQISLAAGSQSSVGGFVLNLGIAFGAVIEEARGGRGDDRMTGNAVANDLGGNDGADVIDGGAGNDSLHGGAGSDSLYGGAGDDLLAGDDSTSGVAAPEVFRLVATDAAAGAALDLGSATLFPTQSFTLELVWQQAALGNEHYVLQFGNFAIYRHADGAASILFGGAEVEDWHYGILPPALTDGAAHRLSISFDDLTGALSIYLDGVRTAERVFPTTTRGLDVVAGIVIDDQAAVGDIRLFDHARSAQDIWDNAWTHLPDPLNTAGLLHNWQGDGSGNLVNVFDILPDLTGSGPVGTLDVTLQAQSVGNAMQGGAGNDSYHVFSTLDTVQELAGQGTDEVLAHVDFALASGQAVERLSVAEGSGGITLAGNGAVNRLTSSAGDADTLAGGGGNDSYHLYHSEDRVEEAAGGGTDTILAHANHVLASGTAVETLRAMGLQALTLVGNGLANRLVGSTGHGDTLAGGAGNDRFYLYNAAARVTEAAAGGLDRLYAYADCSLAAGSHVEELHAMGNAGRDLTGNELANIFYSNAQHADTLRGGGGDDIYHLRHLGDRVIEAAGGGHDILYAAVSHSLAAGSQVEELHAAGPAAISLTGNARANAFYGSASHADTLAGGDGNDVYFVQASAQQVIEAAGGGADQLHAAVDYALAAGVAVEEIWSTGASGLHLTGNGLANQLHGSAAFADTLAGGAGNDTYWLSHAGAAVIEAAGGGRDVVMTSVNHALGAGMAVEELRATGTAGLRLTGNALANRIFGGIGADSLSGGAGQDHLYGGEDVAADRFVFASLADSLIGPTRDVIHDFTTGIDRIDLRTLDANTGLAGNQAFGFSPAGPLAFGLWLVVELAQVIVSGDVTGDGLADFEIGLAGITGLAPGDFLL